MSDKQPHFDPVSEDNKRAADAIEEAVAVPSSIEEEMLLEAAELEEAEFGGSPSAARSED
ncbi:MAG: hypothetical protein GWN25_35105 [Actinobacteria bacterium]|nr:hypothetical protein [Actinomycetota bacterium]NIW32123.1 hypothetical protein [Actinomycetota bacterium]